jgi:C4-dicarboxylate-specific signal transduction histidine kinase
MILAIILALIAVLVALGSTYSAYQYRQITERELDSLKTDVLRLRADLQHYETQNAILTRENHDLLQRLVKA